MERIGVAFLRIVLTKYLKDGDIIARDIISDEGSVLLRHNTRFKEAYKSKLIERNITEVYIEDEISQGIEPTEMLDSSTKKQISQDVQSQFCKLENNMGLELDAIADITKYLIHQLSQKEMIIELEDLRSNDQYTYEHCIAVAMLAHLVCNKMQLNQTLKEHIVMGALIHDIGKIIIPKGILNKPGKLTDEEYDIVKGHAELGYAMIKDYRTLNAVTKLIVLCHHEREDQSGYPLGKGEELHIGAKIVAVCDLYHALISDRCYRKKLPIDDVINIVRSEPVNQEIAKIIENSLAYYPVGSMVYLNDGNIAIVEKNFCENIKRPLIRTLRIEDGRVKETYPINLQEQTEYYIIGRYEGEI